MKIKPDANTSAMVAALEKEMIHILMQLREIGPLYFHDNDCDDCIFNFGGVVLNEDGTVHVDLFMWDDKLPRE